MPTAGTPGAEAHGPFGMRAGDDEFESREAYGAPSGPPDAGRPPSPGPRGSWRGEPAPRGGGPRRYGADAAHRDAQAGHRHAPSADAQRADLVLEDEELVAGRHPVEEAFAARRDARRLLVVPQRREALERLVLHATNLRIPVVEVEGGTLTALAGFDGHQGIALVTGPRPFASVDDLLARAIERGRAPFVLVLDSLEDPQNVGSLLRSAEAAGIDGVVFPTRRQAPLSPAAVKASAGAVEHLLLVPVDDLPGTLADLHVGGLRVVGSEAEAPLAARDADLRGPLALVVGSEGQGLGPAVRKRCDLLVRIPMRGQLASLNAAVAGAILLYEASVQRGEEAIDDRPGAARTPRDEPSEALPDEPTDAALRPGGPAQGGDAETAAGEAAEASVEAAAGGPDQSAPASEDEPARDDLLPGGPAGD